MKIIYSFFLLAIISSCQESDNQVNKKLEIDKVQSLMDEQQSAWNSGNLDDFMIPYIHSDSLVFIGSRGLNYGWNKTLSNYQKTYDSPEKMGKLLFENEKIDQIGESAIWIAGRWNLFRTNDTLNGSYLLIWEKIEGQWNIVADHSS